MNYYLELLESYSKLKKRSLKLIAEEGGEAEGEPLTSVDAVIQQYGMMKPGQEQSFPHPSPAPGHESLYLTRTDFSLKARFAKRNSAIVKQTSSPAQAAKKGEGWVELEGNTYQNTVIAAELEEWLNLKNPDANAGDANAIAAENKAREKAEAAQREANKGALHKIFEPLGFDLKEEDFVGDIEDDFDFFQDWPEEDLETVGVWKKALKEFVEGLVNDVDPEHDIKYKIDAANNLVNYVKTATACKRLEKGVAPNATLKAQIESLKDKTGKTSRGELALTKPMVGDDTLDSETYLFGYGTSFTDSETGDTTFPFGEDLAGRALPFLKKLKLSITTAVTRYNNVNKDTNSFISKEWETVSVDRDGTVGDDANRRSKIDENLLAAAGTFLALGFGPGGLGDAELPEGRREFYIGRIKAAVKAAAAEEGDIDKIAQYLQLGIDANNGEAVRTLLSETAGNLVDALKERLTSMFGTDFDSQGFVDELGGDGQKAVALLLLLRHSTVQNIFGDIRPEISIALGDVKSKELGRKVDNGLFFNPNQATALKNKFNKMLGFKGKDAKPANYYTQTMSIDDFLKEELLSRDDIPDDYFTDETRETLKLDAKGKPVKLTMVRLSLKTHSNAKGESSGGSCTCSTVLPKEKPNEDPQEREGLRKTSYTSIEKHVSKGAADSLDSFFDSIHTEIWGKDKVTGKIKSSREQNELLYERVKKHMKSLESDSDREEFRKAFAIHLFIMGGVSDQPQLNVVSYVDSGKFTIASDEKMMTTFLENITGGKESKWEVIGVDKEEDNSSIYIKDRATGKTMFILKGHGQRTDVQKTAQYQKLQDLHERSGSSEEGNSSTMLRQFLSAQAKMIQELLATE